MPIEWFAIHTPVQPGISAQNSWYGVLVVLLYAVLTIFLFIRNSSDFHRLNGRGWILLATLSASGAVLCHAVLLHAPDSVNFASSFVPPAMLALLPILLCSLWLGRGPAMVVGLVTGISWMLLATGRITQPFEMALIGLASAAMLHQPYQGWLGRTLRQPLVAAALSVILIGWPITLFAIMTTGNTSGLENLEQAFQSLGPLALVYALVSVVPGILTQGIIVWRPDIHPSTKAELIPPPWERNISQRILYTLVPLGVAAILTLMGTLFLSSYQVATRFVVDQLSRDALNIRENVSLFVQIGRSSIYNLAQSSHLGGADPPVDTQDNSFFQQIVYVDTQGKSSSFYAPATGDEVILSPEEATLVEAALSRSVSGEVVISPTTESDAQMSFVAPVVGSDRAEPTGVLIGRTRIGENPILKPGMDLLQGGFLDAGTGFIIDGQDHIIIDPADVRASSTFELNDAHIVAGNMLPGTTIRDLSPDGTHELIYRLPADSVEDWSIVVTVPEKVVLNLAAQIALPVLGLFVLIAGVSLPLLAAMMGQITNRLNVLLGGVEALTSSNFSEPIHLAGEDEIGRLGRAFERMRIDLKNRLDEQERLLRVSRSVSSSLELFRAMPPILSSALEVTNAIGIRLVVQKRIGDVTESYAAGEAAAVIAPLDSQLMSLVERQGTVVISQLWRASNSLDMTALPARIQSLVAMPLRSESSFLGIFWLAYDHEHMFEQAEMTFLSTLAGQAAIAIANARLFAEVEAERGKLQAVLASTTDAMIVADNNGRIILMNPAAENFLGVRAEDAMTQRVSEVIRVPELASLLTDLQEPVSVIEMPGEKGTSLLANSSTIVGPDGAITGRVALMRDITALRELDNIKTVFLRMVSHDLRSPLTYMRGYLSLLPMIGEVNEKQAEAIQKVNNGIDSISDLTERLLHLSRLQFGDQAELELSMVDVETLLHEIAAQQGTLAPDRTITLEFDAKDQLPLLAADEMLYRQAITNLVNNALKYTPEGEEILVHAFQFADADHPQIRVSVTDHGIGIREEDQKRLFEAFFRVPQREGEPARPRGNGLGLALVKAIAAAHNGTVEVESVFGAGSTFHLTLPIRSVDEL